MKKILALFLLTAVFIVGFGAIAPEPTVNAQIPDWCRDNPDFQNLPECRYGESQGPQQSTRTEIGDTRGDCSVSLHPDDCGIMAYIRIITDGLTVLVGVVVVGMLVFGGIQYSAAGSNPQMVQAAKKHISQALLALVIYIFMAAFLQWLVPGGVFN